MRPGRLHAQGLITSPPDKLFDRATDPTMLGRQFQTEFWRMQECACGPHCSRRSSACYRMATLLWYAAVLYSYTIRRRDRSVRPAGFAPNKGGLYLPQSLAVIAHVWMLFFINVEVCDDPTVALWPRPRVTRATAHFGRSSPIE